MALVLALLSLLLAFVGFMTLGDFPQMVFKPQRWLLRVVFQYRYLLMALSVLLYLLAIIVHVMVAPTNSVVLVFIGALILILACGALFVVPKVIFPSIQRHPTWIARDQATRELAPEDLVLGIEVNDPTAKAEGLCLDSTATLRSERAAQLWFQHPTHQGQLTTAPFLPSLAEQEAFASLCSAHRPDQHGACNGSSDRQTRVLC